jgi:hypothetical protein
MPSFTPPVVQQGSDDPFFGRYLTNVGVSVVWNGTTFVAQPYPWLGEIRDLVEGQTWFQGGRTYQVDDSTASLLQAAGFTTSALGYGEGLYGVGGYGGTL